MLLPSNGPVKLPLDLPLLFWEPQKVLSCLATPSLQWVLRTARKGVGISLL